MGKDGKQESNAIRIEGIWTVLGYRSERILTIGLEAKKKQRIGSKVLQNNRSGKTMLKIKIKTDTGVRSVSGEGFGEAGSANGVLVTPSL